MTDGYFYEVHYEDYSNQGQNSCLRIDSNDIDFLRELHLDILFKASQRSKESSKKQCPKDGCETFCNKFLESKS